MTFISKIDRLCNSRLVIASVGIVGCLLFTTLVYAADTPEKTLHDSSEAPQAAKVNCPEHDRPPVLYLYENVKRVALLIRVPGFWQIARDCHGREEDCADKNPVVKGQADLRPAYIRDLKNAYQPHESLSAKFLEDLFIARIKQRVLPKLAFDENCQPPELVTNSDDRALTEPNTLVIYVQVRPLQSSDKEHRAVVLRTIAFRPDMDRKMLIKSFIGEHLTPIGLAWPDYLVRQLVDENIQSLMSHQLPY